MEPPKPPQQFPQRHPKPFLEELQALDDRTKRKIIIIGSLLIMAVVLYVWLGYFNSIVGQGAASLVTTPTPSLITTSTLTNYSQ